MATFACNKRKSMKEIKPSFVIAILVVIFAGCRQDNKMYEKLEKIDSLIEHKDYSAAYAQLTDIDKANVTEEKLSAYYNLLMTHALYSLRQPIANDSLINISIAYYEKAKNKEKLAQSLYYKGMLNDNLDNVELAITNLKKAEDIAVSQKYSDLLYKIYLNFSYINAKAGNNEKALDYASKSLSVSEQMGDMTKKANSLEKLITAFSRIERDDSVNIYTEKLLRIIPQVDKNSLPLLFSCLGVSYANMKKYHEAEQYIKKSLDYGYNAHSYYILGGIYIAQGKEQEAWDAWMKALETGGVETKVSVFDYIVEYKKQKGEYREMARWNDSLLLYKDSLKRMQNTEQMLQVQETADKKTELDKSDKLAKRRILIILCVTVVLVLFFAIYSIRKRASLKESLGRMDMVNKINATLKKQLETAENNRQQAIETLQQKLESENEKKISDLIYGRQCLDKLRQGGTMAKWNTKEQKAVIEYYSVLNPKVMEEIRTGYKKLTNYNMMFLITESWDLSDEDKAFLLNTTPGAVRTMRSRLAKKKV